MREREVEGGRSTRERVKGRKTVVEIQMERRGERGRGRGEVGGRV